MGEVKRQQLLLDAAGVVVCVALLAGGYYFGFGSVMRHKSVAMAQYRQLGTVREKGAAAKATVHQLKRQIADLKAGTPRDVLKPANEVRPNARLQEITSLAASRGLTLKAVEPGQAHADARFRTLPLRLTGTGSFRGCVQFLHDLRKNLEDTTVVDFRFTGAPETPGSPVTFDLDLCWYAAAALADAGQEH
jgi:Tfp pilus assembly protein PilO